MKKTEFIVLLIINVILILFEMNTIDACVIYLKTTQYYHEVFIMVKYMCLTGIVLSMFNIVRLIIRRK